MLMEELKADILTGKIKMGDKLPSENQLSNRYKISRHTVRKALGLLEQEGLIEAKHGKGTFCAGQKVHLKSSRNIAVITTYMSDYIFPRLIQGIDSVLTENSYSLLLKTTKNSRYNEAKCLEDILTKEIDGLIIEPSKSQIFCRHEELYQKLDTLEIPYVFIQGCYPQMREKPHILMDDCKGGYLVTKHLIDLGHRNIAGIFKADDSQGSERHKGYVNALQEAGILYHPDWVIWFHTEDRISMPEMALRFMLERGEPVEGIICYNDQIALEAIRTLKKVGVQVPKDISVTGYDNSILAENGVVHLTTIAHPQEKLGAMAARLLLDLIHKKPLEASKESRVIEPELIIRESSRIKHN